MTIINLRDYYPFYTSDNFIDVPDEVYELLKEFDRKEAAYRLRTYRHKAYYSLDRNDGIEHEALFVSPSPYELLSLIHILLSHSVMVLYSHVPATTATPATTMAPVAAIATSPMPGIKYTPAAIGLRVWMPLSSELLTSTA